MEINQSSLKPHVRLYSLESPGTSQNWPCMNWHVCHRVISGWNISPTWNANLNILYCEHMHLFIHHHRSLKFGTGAVPGLMQSPVYPTCVLLLISMHWHRQVIFESKGDKLSSSTECRIRTRVFGTESPADWIPADELTELWRIKLLKLNSIACPYDQRVFGPVDPTASWLRRYTYLLLLISILWHRQAIF